LAGAPYEVTAEAVNTPMNPLVASAFALAIIAGGEGPVYPGIPGHEPDIRSAGKHDEAIRRAMSAIRALARDMGSYVSESDYFELDWQSSHWGENYQRLLAIKRHYDPEGLFWAHHAVGSEHWSSDGFTYMPSGDA
jgi:FAD/FMN-containing dehydrogenase